MLWSVILNALNPALNIDEAVSIGQVKHNDNAIGWSVKSLGDGSEPFLAGCVEHLDMDFFLVRAYVVSRDEV